MSPASLDLFSVTPPCDVTFGTNSKVELWSAHRPHAIIAGKRRLELDKSQVIIVVFISVIFGLNNDFLYGDVLLEAFFSIQFMFTCAIANIKPSVN